MTFSRLSEISDALIDEAARLPFVRSELFRLLNPPKQNIVILKGARGVGKSTLIQQFLGDQKHKGAKVLYVSADSTLLNSSLSQLAYDYQKRGGQFLAFDEIHKYPDWQAEIKTILDSFPHLKLLASGSSSMHLDYAAVDLSRRHVMVNAKGLSFREFIKKNYGLSLPSYSLMDITHSSESIAIEITHPFQKNQLDLLNIFKIYLREGYFLSRDNYPFESLYYQSLLNTISSVIDADLSYTYTDIDNISKYKIKSLLKHIATLCPFTPNISELSRNLGIASDNTLKKYLYYLSEGEILINLYAANKSHKDFQKPQKIFLNNTNFIYAHDTLPNLGTVRETFVANCLVNQGLLTAPTSGDFCLDGHVIFEIGGKSKRNRQIKSVKEGYIFADDILSVDHGNLPLWLLGFLW